MNWNDLYIKNAPKLIGICRRYVKENSIAEDLVQDAFIKMFEHYNSYRGDGSIENWMKKIVINEALQFIRSNKKIKRSADELEEISEYESPEDISNTAIEDLLDEADFSESILLKALDSIPEYYRIVFNLYSMEGYKHKEIAEQLNIPIGTSKSYLNRAREQLKNFLIDYLNQKEKKKYIRVASLIIMSPKDPHQIDSIFQKKLENLSIEPVKHLTFSHKEIPYNTSSKVYFSSTKVLMISMIVGIGLAWIYMNFEYSKKKEKDLTKSFIKYNPEIVKNINKNPEKKLIKTPSYKNDVYTKIPPTNDSNLIGVKPPPVVVHKKIFKKELIVRKDTVFYEN